MNIPVILDIIIGLVFIYLTLSLLASEIQELLATILQWRAAHLKKSIEVLIAGNPDVREDPLQFTKVRKLANYLYAHPLIKNLNYKAQDPLERWFRQIVTKVGKFFRKVTKNDNVFGEASSAPSYIPSETFASSLIESLKIYPLIQTISEGRLEKFKEDKLADIKYIIDGLECDDDIHNSLNREFQFLADEFNRIVKDYKQERSLLNNSLDRMSDQVNFFIENTQIYLPANETSVKEFQNKMRSVRALFESPLEREVVLSQIIPSFSNILKVVRQTVETEETVATVLTDKEGPIYSEIKEAIDALPDSLKSSLYMLAERAEIRAKETGETVNQFQYEVEVWFDNAMQRASGVYKRNARGIAIMLGILIAVAANADTLYMVENLSKDSFLRATVNEYAEQLVTADTAPSSDRFGDIQEEVDRALSKVPLPIGWEGRSILEANPDRPIWLAVIKRVFGWLLSGIAISMGSAFWFDLLQKLIGIRNSGGKPSSPSEPTQPYPRRPRD
jgi:hypothetical protein